MTYVDWFNHRRLHGEITSDTSYMTPVDAEDDYYRQTTTAPRPSPNNPSSHQTQGGSPRPLWRLFSLKWGAGLV